MLKYYKIMLFSRIVLRQMPICDSIKLIFTNLFGAFLGVQYNNRESYFPTVEPSVQKLESYSGIHWIQKYW